MEIEIDDENVNVKDIMKQIKANINKREYLDDLVSSSNNVNIQNGINVSQLEEYQLALNRTWNNSAVFPIVSNRKIIGGMIVFIKKVIRKTLGWYINPIVKNQTEFNANVVRAYNELITQIKYMEMPIKEISIKKEDQKSNVKESKS